MPHSAVWPTLPTLAITLPDLFASTTAANKYTNVAEGFAITTTADCYAYVDLPSAQSDFWVSFYVMTPSVVFATSPRQHLAFYDTSYSTTQPIFQMEVSATSPRPVTIKAWNGTTLTNLATHAGAVAVSTLQRFDIHIKKDDSLGVADVYVGGVLQFSFSGDTNLFTSAGINRIQFGVWGASTTTTFRRSSWPMRIPARCSWRSRAPTASGGVAQWAGAFTGINETGIDDTAFMTESTLNEQHTFTKTALPAAFNTGYNVAAVVLSARTQASAGYDVAGVFRIGGVNYQRADFNATTSYRNSQIVIANNPATSAAWTFAAADAAEMGVKLVSA